MAQFKTMRRYLAALFLLLVAVGYTPTVASAAPSDSGCVNRNINQVDKLLECVDAEDVFVHLAAFQEFADASDGTRASGTSGYDDSVDYIDDLLSAAGFDIERQEFAFFSYQENSSSLSLDGVDTPTQTMSFSGSGSVVDGLPIAVDLELGLGNSSTSGCELSDFDGLDFSGDSDVAVMQRGACAFADKAINAEAAGAEAAIIFNQGNAPGRFGLINGTLGGPVGTIPVLDVAYNDGVAAASAEAISLAVDAETTETTTENIIAELPGVNEDNVVMAGAHLDSVFAGPGIQDNGSGSAGLLSIALALGENKKYVPQNTLRFAWWGAEESGLIGSFEYFTNADFGLLNGPQEEIDRISSYLNFDMVASPNFIYGVYDADQSTFAAPVPVPAGSDVLEDLFEAYYSENDIPYEDTEFSGRSDYQVFILLDIPASGLFTGAEVIKTAEQESIWGGTAGDQFDPCYHLACDTIDNVGIEPMDVNVDAMAYAIFNLAATTEAVNGVPGIDLPGSGPEDVDLDGPQGTFLNGGGGLDHDHDHGGATS